jgi:hypothetical protein
MTGLSGLPLRLFVVLTFASALAGCTSTSGMDGGEGQRLSQLDMAGDPPVKIVLAGPDHVIISEGPKLAVAIDGNPLIADRLRFTLKDGTLGIMGGKVSHNLERVTVTVTMPAPQEVILAGSGVIEAAALSKDAKITLAGSGEIHTGTLSGDTLAINLAGSGTLQGGGAVKSLDLTLASSGNADLAALRSDHVKVTIAGSGGATLASDGDVSATILGSGLVRVRGRATCKASSMGSGKLICDNETTPESH